jgi:hypothetical protein
LKHLVLACALALVPMAAFAQDMPAEEAAPAAIVVEEDSAEEAAPPAPIVTETLDVAAVRRGLLDAGGSAGGLTLVARTWQMRSNLFTQTRTRLTRVFRLLGPEDGAMINGACILRTEGRTLLGVDWNQRTTQVYACAVEDQPEDQFMLEVAVPAFREGGFSIGGFSVSTQEDVPDEEQQAILRATMLYRGVAYEAIPTGFADHEGGGFSMMGGGQRRIVEGYSITREGEPVGGIAFNMRNVDDATVTVPVADADGREAVLYMALQLMGMPDMYSPNVREEIANP